MGSHHSHGTGDRSHGRCRKPRLIPLLAMSLVVAAVVKELRKPQGRRTWHGTVAGFVPYDFRVPTPARIRAKVWDPEGHHLVSPHVFGVGWVPNWGRIVGLLRGTVTPD